ncbi:MAG: hypothetical protein KDN20_12460 [Verrucomicrobiae bacterium]|nr:hypothetical protein [Verrucomicrobiae bacterium]
MRLFNSDSCRSGLTYLSSLLLAASAAGSALAQNGSEATTSDPDASKPLPETLTAPAKLDFAQFPGALVDKVVVPVPAEIFAVLDKLAEPNWTAQIQLPKINRPANDRLRLALDFGATVGEGFIAVEAEQSQPIQDIGRRVLKLAEALGLQDAVVPHCQSIIDSADVHDWRKVRAELDNTQQTVRDTMESLRDGEMSTLVSLGGWLRGTQALTNLISEAYTLDKAELLNQPDLVSHFHTSVIAMKPKVREHEDVVAVADGLGEILEALSEAESNDGGDPESGVVSSGTVKRIGEVCDSLLKRFYLDPETAPDEAGDAPASGPSEN